MSDYSIGTVATATVRGVEGVRVMRARKAWITTPAPRDGDKFPATYSAIYDNAREVTDIRPLVVLDPKEHGFDPATLAANLRQHTGYKRLPAALDRFAEDWRAIRKPPEPQGLGAVVEDAHQRRWVRTQQGQYAWRSPDALHHPYAEIDAVRVLSEGVR